MMLPEYQYKSEALTTDFHDDDCPVCNVARGNASLGDLMQCIRLLDSRLAERELEVKMFTGLIIELTEGR